ncbi:MAG: FecR family protein, partial [Mangrovibacterium sp.]
MDDKLIQRYFSGEASEAEVRNIFQWIDTDIHNRKEFLRHKKLWVLTVSAPGNSKKAWNSVFLRTHGSGRNSDRSISRGRKWFRYAAVSILFFSLGIMVHYLNFSRQPDDSGQSEMMIEVPAGQMANLVLCDGTRVMLNSGSTLVYPVNFDSGERIVKLDGEAFFDVQSDREHPFVVKTYRLNFKVYGTSFNIQAYSTDREINTTLIEGSLGVVNPEGDELTKISPGEHVKYLTDTGNIQISTADTDLYTSWRDGIITFKNERLKNIARKIERWY